jgi:hypothetical protein
MLEFADAVESHAGHPGFGSAEHVLARAAEIRAKAAELVEGLPL